MKILFIKTSIGVSFFSGFDMGIASMSAVLKIHGHNTKYFFVGCSSDIDRLMSVVERFKPEVVAFSVSESSFVSANTISGIIKRKFPNIFIVCGGVYVTLCPDVLLRAPTFNGICLGEGEEALLDLVESLKNKVSYLRLEGWWFRDGKRIYRNIPRKNVVDINLLPLPDREIFSDDGNLFWGTDGVRGNGMAFIFSRGCPFNCSYCCNHALNRFYNYKFMRIKDPKIAVAEIRDVIAKYRVDYIVMQDDTFTVDHEWLERFLDEYKDIKIPFECNIRADTVNAKIMRMLKEAGCCLVRMGVESGNENLRKTVLNRNMSNKQIIVASELAKKLHIKTGIFLIMGLPGESKEKFLETVSLAAKLDADFIDLFVFFPYQGTDLYNICKSQGYFPKRRIKLVEERRDTVLDMPNFKREEILYLYRNFDVLKELSKKRKGRVRSWHQKYMFWLMSRTPGDSGYVLTKFLWNVELYIKNFLKK